MRLVQGLQKYKVLLTHVKKEYPDNALLPHIKYNSDLLIHLIEEKVRTELPLLYYTQVGPGWTTQQGTKGFILPQSNIVLFKTK